MLKNIMNPFIYERTKDGESFYDIYARLAKEEVIFLTEDVSQESAGIITSMLYLMDKEKEEDDDKPIELWINTDGGDTDAFFAIYDMMQMIKAPIKTVCIGKAYSAGALLLGAGSKGLRACTRNSSIMLHQVQISGIGGTGTEVANEAKEVKRINDKIIDIIARHTGQFASKVSRDINNDLYLNAEDALKYGLIDKIINPTKTIPELKKKTRKSKEKPE